MAKVVVRPRARRDMLEIADYLEGDGGEELAERFLDAVGQTSAALALTPKAGVLCGFRKAAIRDLRRWPITDFERWLIFYRAMRSGVEIVHIVHGARDLGNLFGK